jgi:large subunit ribosomal protein L19
MDTLIKIEPNANIPALTPGDTVKVAIKIVEGERVRNQMFQGVVIKVKKGGANASFTVRRVAYGVGVERTFFFTSPSVDKVEVLRHGKVRRARLYYLRGLTAKKARIAEKRPKEAQAETEHTEQ